MLPVVPVAPLAVDEPAVVGVLPPPVTVGSADDPALDTIAAERPVTWTLWPTCLSRSSPPESVHVAAAPLFIALLPPVVDDEPAVVEDPPPVAPEPLAAVLPVVVLVPLAVVPAAPVVLVLDEPLSIRAFVSIYPPDGAFARQPVTLMSFDEPDVVCPVLEVVVDVCALSVAAHANAAATANP